MESYLAFSNEELAKEYQQTKNNNILEQLLKKNTAAIKAETWMVYTHYQKRLAGRIEATDYFQNTSLDFDDLLQEARLGFAGGVEAFDSDRGAFSTCMKQYMDVRMRKYIINTLNSGTEVYVRAIVKKIRDTATKLGIKDNIDDHVCKIGKKLHLSSESVRENLRIYGILGTVSLDYILDFPSNKVLEPATDGIAEENNRILAIDIAIAFQHITPIQQEVVIGTCVYGYGCRELGLILGKPTSTIRSAKRNGLKKLRELLREYA